MKKNVVKKLISMVLVVGCVVMMFSCGKKTETAPDGSTMAVGKNQNLVVSMSAAFPPYEYKDGGDYMGIDVEVARAIGNKLGYKIDILDIAFDTVLPAVQNGKADFAMSGITVTEDRKKNVDFTTTYQTAVQSVMTVNDGYVTTLDDLKGKVIGVQQGTTGDIYATGDFGENNIVRFLTSIDAAYALKVGKVDAVIIDDQVAISLVDETNNGRKGEELAKTDLIILDTAYANEEYAIAVKKGNTELLNKLNGAIEEMKANGELQAIVDKYIKK